VQADIRRPEVGQGGGIGQSETGHTGHGQSVDAGPGGLRRRAPSVRGRGRDGRGHAVVRRSAAAETAGPGTGETAHRPEEGETRHAHTRPNHGLVHRLLVPVLLHVHTDPVVPGVLHTAAGVHHSLLVGLHELGHQPGDLYDIQQGLPAQFPARVVQIVTAKRCD